MLEQTIFFEALRNVHTVLDLLKAFCQTNLFIVHQQQTDTFCLQSEELFKGRVFDWVM